MSVARKAPIGLLTKKLVVAGLMSLGALGSATVMAATEVTATSGLVNMFLSASSTAIPTTSYTNVTYSPYGTVQVLRSHPRPDANGYPSGYSWPSSEDGTVWSRLYGASGSGASGKTFSSTLMGGYNYLQISESGYGTGQCVAFAKYMAPSLGATSAWVPGRALSTRLSASSTYTQASANVQVPAGTVIAHFGGKSRYSDNTTNQHVAVVLSVALDPSTSKVLGLNVVDQNGMNDGRIVKHLLPWNGSAQVGAKNYHIVAQ